MQVRARDQAKNRAASRFVLPNPLRPEKLQDICSTYGVLAIRAQQSDIPTQQQESDVDIEPRTGASKPRYLAPANASVLSGVWLLFGLDHCVDAAREGLQAATSGSQDVVLRVGTRITSRLAAGHFLKTCATTRTKLKVNNTPPFLVPCTLCFLRSWLSLTNFQIVRRPALGDPLIRVSRLCIRVGTYEEGGNLHLSKVPSSSLL